MATPRWITAAEVTQEEAGDVQGPDESVDGNIALFDGTTGKLLKAAGVVEGVATIDATTNILIGDGAGNAIDSTVAIDAIGGSFLSANTARIDPSGDDDTGTVGDLSKPFLTVQAAIDAFELSPPVVGAAIIDIGNNQFAEDLTTSLPFIVFRGSGAGDNTQASVAFSTLVLTNAETIIVSIIACGYSGSISSETSSRLEVFVSCGGQLLDVSNTAGELFIASTAGDGTLIGTVSAPGSNITLFNFNNDAETGSTIVVDSAGSAVLARRTRIKDISAANGLNLLDSRVTGTNVLDPQDVTHEDIMLNPAGMDFSTLPTSQPTEYGKAWIDTTGGFNIVKVKL